MSIPFVDLKQQYSLLGDEIRARMDAVLKHGQYIMGPEVGELEDALQQFTRAAHCITSASGTEALLISLMALGVGPGDEVVTTPFTFIATAEVIVLLGAKPIFVDVEPDTCNINPKGIEAVLTPRTKAIIPVSLYGQPCDMTEINEIAQRHGGVPVIEDAAQSFGAMYRGQRSCNLSSIGCTSFFPSKPLGCYGDGGAIFTNDDDLAQTCREIRVHGQSARYVHTRVGVGGRMDTLQAAVVLAKLGHFEEELKARSVIGEQYNHLIDSLPEQTGIARVAQREDRTSVFGQYTLLCDDRDSLKEALSANDIPTGVHYPIPLNEQPAYRHLCCPDCMPVAAAVSRQVLSLPMSPYLTVNDQEKIFDVLSSFVSKGSEN